MTFTELKSKNKSKNTSMFTDLPLEIQVHISICTQDIDVFRTCILVSKLLSIHVRENVDWFKKYFYHKEIITLLKENDTYIVPLSKWIPIATGCRYLNTIRLNDVVTVYRKSYHRTNGTFNTSLDKKQPCIEIYAITSNGDKYVFFHSWQYHLNDGSFIQIKDKNVSIIGFYRNGNIAYIKFNDSSFAEIPDTYHYNYLKTQYTHDGIVKFKPRDKYLVTYNITVHAVNYNIISYLMNAENPYMDYSP